MDPIYIGDEAKEELDSDTYRIAQTESELEVARKNDLSLYLSALSPADIADFYWGSESVHGDDPVVAEVGDFTDKEGGTGAYYALVKRS